MPTASYRFRRCPECGRVHAAGDYSVVSTYRGWGSGRQKRRCPSCGHVAPTRAFAIVRRRRARA